MSLSLSYEYEYFDHALDGSDPAPNPKSELTQFRTTQLGMSYTFSDRFQMRAWIPYRQITSPKTHDPGGPEETRITRQFSGIGDIVAMSYFKVLRADTPRRPSVVLGLGMRLPSGSSQPNHDWGTGVSRDPVLQAGSGSLDPIVAASGSVSLGTSQIYANTIARWSTDQNIHGYRFGDEYQASVGANVTVSEWMDVSVSSSGVFSGHDFDATKGSKVGNTGGQWYYVSPGVTFRSGLINTAITLQVPVHQDVNTTPEAYAQLVSDYVFRISFSCGLDTKKSASVSAGVTPRHLNSVPHTDIETISLGDRVELTDHLVQDKYTLFEFYGDRCLSCEAVEPELRSLMSSNPNIVLRKINIGMGDTPIISQYQIKETPTFILFNREGTEILRYTGTTLGEVKALVGQ